MLAKYLGGKINDNDFFFKIRTSSNYAIELGRPLDYYHDNEPERLGYLSKLSKDDVLALLMSDPNFFYTSSNNLLFDRLMKDFAGRNISDVIQAHKMKGTQQELNLFFRAMNYDRLCGHDNSIFQSSELQKIFSQMASQLNEKRFDLVYYYLLANSLSSLRNAGLAPALTKRLRAATPKAEQGKPLEGDDAKKAAAIEFLLKAVQSVEGIEQGSKFDYKKYLGADGKLNIVQIFAKRDVGTDHWACQIHGSQDMRNQRRSARMRLSTRPPAQELPFSWAMTKRTTRNLSNPSLRRIRT